MNITINSYIALGSKIFKLFAVIFFVNTLIFIFLPKQTPLFESGSNNTMPFVQINLSRAFDMKQEVTQSSKKSTSTARPIDTFILTAIYAFENLDGWIVIATKEKPQESSLVSQGESYLGYEVLEVHSNKVIFQKDKVHYELFLNSEKDLKTTFQDKSQEDNKNLKVSKKFINQYVKDFDAIWKSIAIKEVLVNGAIDGFKVISITKNSPFDTLGLQTGDIIKKVNNTDLKSYADAFNIYNNIGKLNNLKITILRNNTPMEINYEMD